MTFEIKHRDAAGRICRFTTKHGAVTTPTLMPVINLNKMIITPKEMQRLFGTEIIITNSYIINKHPHLRDQALDQGIHSLVGFDGPIMTDSGTFQSYVYGDIDVDPIHIVKFQQQIGSDIGTILDLFGTPNQTKNQARSTVNETLRRAQISIPEKKDMLLACTIQGSVYPDLRYLCAQKMSRLDADFYPIGGVVPLMENQRYADLTRIILASKQGLNPAKPVHLFGAGHPLIFPLAVALGCDFFDSSAYAKYAADQRLIFPWGTEQLSTISELPCICPVCTHTTAAELKTIEQNEQIKLIAQHNLYVSYAELKNIRNAIQQGCLWELVEQRATSNPHLLEALKELRKKESKIWLEQFEPISKTHAVFYTGDHTIHRPTIYRYHQRLLHNYRKKHDTTIVFPDTKRPYAMTYTTHINKILSIYDANLVVASPFGPIPLELDEMYPAAQCVFPRTIDCETQELAKRLTEIFLKKQRRRSLLTLVKTKKYAAATPVSSEVFEQLKIGAMADMQFGRGAGTALFAGHLRIIKSKHTNKIRMILVDDTHVVSLRAHDGLFTLKYHGGERLHRAFKKPRLRVIVKKDAVPFVHEGKSVFAKFVIDCDPKLRPYDECLIVDAKDTYLGVGRCILNRSEMQSFLYGIAVQTRETQPQG
ncbi:MAG: tRNA guanosine(15) transglycosylase TgtA [Candidatus Thermoplasmatota archaeon]